MSARSRLAVLAVLVGLTAAACSSPSGSALRQSLGPLPARAAVKSTPTTTTPPDPGCTDPAKWSYAPGDVTVEQARAQLNNRDVLAVGVDQGTLGWGFRDPLDGKLKGLEVDLLNRIALELGVKQVVFKTLTTGDRISAVQHHDVDMVASLLTTTCRRWSDVDFSTVYFDAHQDVLVNQDSTIRTVQDLNGQRVCATRGSTSITNITGYASKAIIYPVDSRIDCLVALQEGTVDAITSDDTVLQSFKRQEKVAQTRLLGVPLEDEPYAIAMPKHKEALVRYVNLVLDQMRHDGTLEQLYVNSLPAPVTATVPDPGYR